MKGNELLDKMGQIAPEYIEAADAQPVKKRGSWIKWAGAAACLGVAVLGTVLLLPRSQPQTEENKELPMLSVSADVSASGFEGYMAYDISELVNNNPWSENSAISTLPVYKNQTGFDENHNLTGADFDTMEELALETAEKLGLDKNSLSITDDTPDEEYQIKVTEKFESIGQSVPEGYFDPTKIIVEAQGIEIEVDKTLTVTVYFEPPIALPSEYNFTHFATYDEKMAVAQYFKEQYSDFIGADSSQMNIYGGDYDIYGRQKFSVGFFSTCDNEAQNIVSYNFNRTAFHCDDDGKLFIARAYCPDLSEKMGEYPIISVSKARELLLNGNYISDVMYGFSGEEFIRKTELVYRTSVYDEYFMPFYRFYVELPDAKRDNGLNTYGAFYVPAVDGSYISNMPVWSDGFSYVIDPSEK